MQVIQPDYDRLISLSGVMEPVHRPVDIDRSRTGFVSLRSLRIYCFPAGSAIDGHAEEDEVLIAVLAGSVQLTVSEGEVEQTSPQVTLSAVGDALGQPCVAYLPPGGAYRLVIESDAEVAYARATPTDGQATAIFHAKTDLEGTGNIVTFEEASYPACLRLRVVQLRASGESRNVRLRQQPECSAEAFVHVRSAPSDGAVALALPAGESMRLTSWDTVCLTPGEEPTLHVAAGSSTLLLVVWA